MIATYKATAALYCCTYATEMEGEVVFGAHSTGIASLASTAVGSKGRLCKIS